MLVLFLHWPHLYLQSRTGLVWLMPFCQRRQTSSCCHFWWHIPVFQPHCCAGSSPSVHSCSCPLCSSWAHPGTFCWMTFHSGYHLSSHPSASPRWPSHHAVGSCRRNTRSCCQHCMIVSLNARGPLTSLHRWTPSPLCLQSKAEVCYCTSMITFLEEV